MDKPGNKTLMMPGSGTQAGEVTLDHSPTRPSTARFSQERLLGHGGMGAVYRIHDRSLGRSVARKTLPSDASRSRRERFMIEARITAQLQHPGIVPVHDVGVLEDGRPFYTMREIDGSTLTDVIKAYHRGFTLAGERWSLRKLITVLYRVCQTVAFAHSRGVIHRDLKPDNIMVGAFGEVLVMDWGLAKEMSGAEPEQEGDSLGGARAGETQHGSALGTPSYMPPEQARGDLAQVGPHSDVYALGSCLYQILSGKKPFHGTSKAVIKQLIMGPPPDVATIRSVDSELARLCGVAMQRDLAARYPDARAMSRALSDWLDGVQRQERAWAVFRQGEALREEANALALQAASHRAEAVSLSAAEGTMRAAWDALSAGRVARAAAEEREQLAQRHFQGALAIDPSLLEIHHALVMGYRHIEAKAWSRWDPQSAQQSNALVQMHCAQLFANDPLRMRVEAEAGKRACWVLPPRRGGLSGQRQPLQALEAWWASPDRLLTLVGTAGVGKTHLASHFARSRTEECSLVLFCDLSTARSAADIVQQVASAMALPLRQKDSLQQVGYALQARGRMLLVVDNLEQVADHLEQTLGRWLSMAGVLSILATSRSRLGIASEAVLEVSPLDPISAMEMFEGMARLVRPSFRLSASNHHRVYTLLRSLDCLPLAIELAAARMGSLGLSGIESWLSDRFALLRGRIRDPHARALQAALEASWALLTPTEQALLCDCCVFRGGWSLDAAEAVLVDHEGAPVLDVLDALVEDHLLVRTTTDGRIRFTILESVRAFAALKSADQQAGARLRHASHYACHGQQSSRDALDGPGGAARFQELVLERENLLHGMTAPDVRAAAGCALGVYTLYARAGSFVEGVKRLGSILERDGLPAQAQAQLLEGQGWLLRAAGQLQQARINFEQAVAIYRSHGSRREMGMALGHLGILHQAQGQIPSAQVLYEQALVIHRALGNARGEGTVLGYLGMLLSELGQSDAAQQHYEQALAIYRSLSNRHGEGIVLGYLGMLLSELGQSDAARHHYEQALAIHRSLGNRHGEGIVLGYLGALHSEQGQLEAAQQHYEQALALHRALGTRHSEAIMLCNLGLLQQDLGQLTTARAHLEQALTIHRSFGNRRSEGIVLGNLGDLWMTSGQMERARDHLQRAIVICDELFPMAAGAFRGSLAVVLFEQGHPQDARRLLQEGEQQLRGRYKVELGKLLCKRGSIELQDGRAGEARRALAEAVDIATALEATPASELGQAVAALQARMD